MWHNCDSAQRRLFTKCDCGRRALIWEGTKRPRVILKEIKRSTAQLGKAVHRTSIDQTLKKAGVYKENKKLKPYEFDKMLIVDWTSIWKTVLWKDDTKVKNFGLDTKHYFGQKSNNDHHTENNTATKKLHGGMIIFWWCFTLSWTVKLFRDNGLVYVAKHRAILEEKLLYSARDIRLWWSI